MAKREEYYLSLLLLLALSAVATVLDSVYGSMICILIFLVILERIFKFSPIYFVALLPILFFWSTELLSGVVIESGAFLTETGRTGASTGAFARLSWVYSLYIVAGQLTYSLWKPRPIAGSPRTTDSRLEIIFVCALLVAMAAVTGFGAVRGFPLLEGVDRFRFRASADSDAFTSFLSNRFLMFGGLGLTFAAGNTRWLSLFAAIWLFVVSALFGEKFTSLGLGAIFFLMPTIIDRVAAGKALHLRTIILFGAMGAFITTPLILLNYGFLSRPDAALDRLMSRVAGQGQLWFLTDESFGRWINFDETSISAALNSLVNLEEQSSQAAAYTHGMYYVMSPFLSDDFLVAVIGDNGGFIFAHMPYWLMVSGYVGMIGVGLLTFVLYAFNISRIVWAIQRRDLLSLLVWLKLMVWVLAGYTIGDAWFFFGVKNVGLIVAGLAWDRIRNASLELRRAQLTRC